MEQPKEKAREFAVRFGIVGKNIQVQIHTKNVNPQEAIGLLEMAKDQILDNLRKGRQEVFSSFSKPGGDGNKEVKG